MKDLTLDLLFFGLVSTKGVYLHEKIAPCTILAQVTKGAYEVVRGGERIVVESGCCFLAHEGDQLAITHKGNPEMCARFLHFKFSIQQFLKVDQYYRFPFLLNKKEAKPFDEVMDYFELNRGEEDSLLKLASDYKMAFALLEKLLLIGEQVSDFEKVQNRIEKFLPMFHWLKQSLGEKIEVADMAEYVHLSPSRLYKVFQDSFGLSPMNYLKKIRLAEAQKLVITTNKSMEDISCLVGFNNPFHFSREFKLEYSMAPMVYRKQSSGI